MKGDDQYDGEQHFAKSKTHDESGKGIFIRTECRLCSQKIKGYTDEGEKAKGDQGYDLCICKGVEYMQKKQYSQDAKNKHSELQEKAPAIHG